MTTIDIDSGLDTLPSGDSEVDAVVLRLPDTGIEITNWTSYSYNQAFLTPTAAFRFTLSSEDATLVNDALLPGARVELAINTTVQCVGYIDRRTVDSSDRGTVVTVQGRDVLGRVVDSCIDPAFRFGAGSSILDVLTAVLAPFGIDTIYNIDELNVSIVTGLPPGQSGTRPDLKTVKLDQVKPRIGEGSFAYLDRILRHFGLMLWAAADGSVVVDKANFTGPARGRLVHRREQGQTNNVVRGSAELNLSTQPVVIVGFGFGGVGAPDKSRLKVIMVNELVGLDPLRVPLPEVTAIIARYPGALVLPLRAELTPMKRPVGDAGRVAPMFFKDDEAKTLEQLAASVRREMATRQRTALTASYDVVGHTQRGAPWAVNTMVDVDDDVLDIHRPLWLLDKTFSKSSTGGTTSSLRLILPNTLQVAT
jgi:prophage tail gpP-like protein